MHICSIVENAIIKRSGGGHMNGFIVGERECSTVWRIKGPNGMSLVNYQPSEQVRNGTDTSVTWSGLVGNSFNLELGIPDFGQGQVESGTTSPGINRDEDDPGR